MAREIIQFYALDGVGLNGHINRVKENNEKLLIEIHGMGSNCFKNREKIIASEVEKLGIDTICFNTRGSDIVKYVKYKDGKKVLAGTAYEDIEESYYDVLGAIQFALSLGYNSIYLQGHSLGATKVVYTYSKMQKENKEILKYIKGLILLSLVDVPDMARAIAGEDNIKLAEEKESKNEIFDLMPTDSFIHLISVKTFLKYAKYCKEFDFAKYSEKDDEFNVLNNIDIPLFMRWGDTNELIKKSAKEQVKFMMNKINNNRKDIGFIEGANHSYNGKEDELSKEICDFLKNIK